MMELGCIIQARMGSVRLPGKIMKELDSKKTCLDYIIKQLQDIPDITKIVIATTDLDEDDIIQDFGRKNGIKVFRGKTFDVLDRFYNCAKEFSMINILRITSDCPLIDPNIVLEMIKKMNTGKFDYVSNAINRTFPIGLDAEIFSFTALEKSWKSAELPSEREHVTPYIKKNSKTFRQYSFENNENRSDIRITLDTYEDLMLIRNVVSKISNRPILLKDIMKLFDNEPTLLEINKNIKHDGYDKSLKEDKNFREKMNKDD